MEDRYTLAWTVIFLFVERITFARAQIFGGPVLPDSFLYHIGEKICYVTTETVTSPSTTIDSKCIVHNIKGSTVLGVRRYGDSMFLGDSGNSELERRRLDENKQFIISYGAHGVNGLTVDWSANVVYWTETSDGSILAARTDVDEQYIIELLSNRDGPTGITVDPRNRSLYWGEAGKIYRSHTDGTNWAVFLETEVGRPGDLAADQPDSRLYWVDMQQNSIKSVRLDGTELRVVTRGSPGYTIKGITLSQYLLSWGQVGSSLGHGVFWANKTDGTVIRQLNTTETISDVVYFGRYPQHDTADGLCTTNNGGCPHICLHTQYHKPVCRCSFGYSSTDGGKTCTTRLVKDRTFLLVTDWGWWSAFQVPLDSSPTQPIILPLGREERPIGIQYDIERELIYWIDRLSKTIRKCREDGSDKRDVYSMPQEAAPESLALDVSEQKLYVTDSGRDVIFSVTTDGGNYTNVTNTGLDKPRDLILDVDAGYMYWTDWGDTPKIERARIGTGNERTALVTSLVKPNGLTGDFQNGYLYWTDSERDELERARLDGSDRRLVVRIPGSQMYGLTVSGPYLYVADHTSRHLKRINKETLSYDDWGPGLFQQPFQVKVVTIATRPPRPRPTPNTGSSKSVPVMEIAIAAAVGGVVIIVTIIIIVVMYRRRQRQKQQSTPPGIDNPGFNMSSVPGGVPSGSVASRDSAATHQPVPYRDLYGNTWDGGSGTAASSKAGSKHGRSKKSSKKHAQAPGAFQPLDETSSVGSGSVASRHTSVSMVADGKTEHSYEDLRDDRSTTGSVASRVSNVTDVSFTSTTALFNNRR